MGKIKENQTSRDSTNKIVVIITSEYNIFMFENINYV